MPDESIGDRELVHVESILREIDPADVGPVSPPPSVWEGIVAAVGSTEATGDAAVVDLADRRRRRALTTMLAVAAAAVVVVAGIAVIAPDDADLVARADLAHAPGFDPLGATADATAELVGTSTIRLASADLPADLGEPADLELWLIEADGEGNVVDLVSLGVVGERDEFPIPAGYDPEIYSVVDISIEPRDGVATHSGRSILRGALVEA